MAVWSENLSLGDYGLRVDDFKGFSVTRAHMWTTLCGSVILSPLLEDLDFLSVHLSILVNFQEHNFHGGPSIAVCCPESEPL